MKITENLGIKKFNEKTIKQLIDIIILRCKEVEVTYTIKKDKINDIYANITKSCTIEEFLIIIETKPTFDELMITAICEDKYVTLKTIGEIINSWEISYFYDINNTHLISLLSDLEKIYKKTFFDFICISFYIFRVVSIWLTLISYFFLDQKYYIIITAIFIPCVIYFACNPSYIYKKSGILSKRKFEIVLSAIFYVLGIITPYLIDLFKKL